jgi:quercetin dioxygenase-like cupin family protein
MSEAATIEQSTLVNPGTELAHATADSAPFVPGRRDFLKYRDLGVTKASGGRMRAQVTVATGTMKSTGWHYHLCDSQLVYALKGWVDLQFEDGRTIRVKAGESLYIPGGLKHNETGMSEDFEILEVSVPAEMGTKACEPPAGMQG